MDSETTKEIETTTGPSGPDSPSQSLFRASSTIDDLTRVLASFSTNGESGEVRCCCGSRGCEATEEWLSAKAKLENELRLSAEVGQALLQRHEAYVRQQDTFVAESTRNQERADNRIASLQQSNDQLVSKMAELAREHSVMEKRLTQSQLNLEVSDTSNRTLLKELQETRTAVNRLNGQVARSTGWENKVSSLTQERDDLKQERESEKQRVRLIEMKLAAAKERCTVLTTEVNRLKLDLDQSKLCRADISQELIQDAKARLVMLQSTMSGPNAEVDEAEIIRVLESVVADNEALKRDNAELLNLLAESREDLRGAREDLEQQQVTATMPLSGASKISPLSSTTPLHSRRTSYALSIATTHSKGHRQTDSWAGSLVGPNSPSFYPRGTSSPFRTAFGASATRRDRLSIDSGTQTKAPNRRDLTSPPNATAPAEELLPSPMSEYRPLSPAESNAPGRSNRSSRFRTLSLTQSVSASASASASGTENLSVESDSQVSDTQEDGPRTPREAAILENVAEGEHKASPGSPEKVKKRKTLMLLSRSRGVQTDGTGSEADWILNSPERQRPMGAPSSMQPPRSPLSSSFSAFGLHENASETSSIHLQPSDPQIPLLPQLIERVSTLHSRLNQADIRTLTNRLKRQNLAGMHGMDGNGTSADVLTHLSRSTIGAIVSEVKILRGHFKSALEADPKMPPGANGVLEASLVTRADLRALLKLMKDLLAELAQLRSVVNTVTLDPSAAVRLKDEAINGAEDSAAGNLESDAEGPRARLVRSTSSAMGWIGSAPIISKLFSTAPPPTIDVSDADDTAGAAAARGRKPRGRPIMKTAPKLAPAISASVTTVEVEFASNGYRRSTATAKTEDAAFQHAPATSSGDVTVSSGSGEMMDAGNMTITTVSSAQAEGGSQYESGSLRRRSKSRMMTSPDSVARNNSLLGIFAGAPQPSQAKKDGWVVMPTKGKLEKQLSKSGATPAGGASLNTRRRMMMPGFHPNRLSRIVDAVTDLGAMNGMDDQEERHDGSPIPEHGGNDNIQTAGGVAAALRGRTLHKRGLSDSSIHSTFIKSAGVNPVNRLLTPASVALSSPITDLMPATMTSSQGTSTDPPTRASSYSDRETAVPSAGTSMKDSVLQALSKRVQIFKYGMPGTSPNPNSALSSTAEVDKIPPAPPAAPSPSSNSLVPAHLSVTVSPPRPIPQPSGRQRTRTADTDGSPSSHSNRSQSRTRTSTGDSRTYYPTHSGGMGASYSGSLREDVRWKRNGGGMT